MIKRIFSLLLCAVVMFLCFQPVALAMENIGEEQTAEENLEEDNTESVEDAEGIREEEKPAEMMAPEAEPEQESPKELSSELKAEAAEEPAMEEAATEEEPATEESDQKESNTPDAQEIKNDTGAGLEENEETENLPVGELLEEEEAIPPQSELIPDDEILEYQEEDLWEWDDTPYDGEELLKGYAQMRLNNAKGMLRASNYAGRRLNNENPAQGAVYALLKSGVIAIAAGNRESTVFSGNVSDLDGITKTRFTPEELGYTTFDGQDMNAVYQKVKETVGLSNISPAIHALLADCPYELYWFDKTAGWSSGYAFAKSSSYVEITKYTYKMRVAAAYAGPEDFTVSNENANLINSAIANAQEIVQNASAYSDTGKLDDYRVQICSMVAYNMNAAEDNSTPYGNPWQLIWVFDGDSTTDVVCEGYSKAFQYLCELSSFEASVDCYTVTGLMGGGDHMWNIVSMDGRNYLTDITNCDSGTVGWPTKLFMTGYDSGSVSEGYQFDCGSRTVQYTYDDDTRNTFDDASLTLQRKNGAEPGGEESITITLSSESGGGESVGFLVGGGIYSPGEMITVTASSVEGYVFKGWFLDGNCVSTDYSFSFTAEESLHLTAVYEAVGMARLTIHNAFVMVNGEAQSGGTFSRQFQRGSTIALDYYGGTGAFLRWCNESNMTESVSSGFQFTLVRDMTLTAVTNDAGGGDDQNGFEAFVEFISPYDQVLMAGVWNSLDSPESHPLPIGPSQTGKIFSGWSLNGELLPDAEAILEKINADTDYIAVYPQYRNEVIWRTVNVSFDGALRTWSVRNGSGFSVSAAALEGKTFSHWEDENGMLLGTRETYQLIISENRTLYAVYSTEGLAQETRPVLAFTGVDAVDDGTAHKIAFRVTRDLPAGYSLKRLLVLVSTDSSFGEEDAPMRMLVDNGIPQAVSTLTSAAGTLTVNKKVPDDDMTVYARGYMLVAEDVSGQQMEYYTQIVSARYSDLIG